MHQKSRIRAGRVKRGGQGCARERRLILPFLAPPPPLLLSPCSCFPVFISIFLREVTGYVYLSISSPPPPPFSYLTTRCLRGANIFFLLLSVEPAVFFFCLSLRDGGRGLFWTSICGNQEHQGLFPSVQSIHLSASLLLTVSASVSARRGRWGPGARLFFLLSPPATGACVRVCVLCVV